MEKTKNYDFLSSPLMSSEEIDFILKEPFLDEISSSRAKSEVETELLSILRQDSTGLLSLPFFKQNYR
jgi:hypothetical protein